MLVSAIMPTRGRPEFAARAVECFLAQTWREKELVIVDDLECPSFEQDPPEFRIWRFVQSRRLSIGAKRNIACKESLGDIIIHWDDDDWSAPGRMADQVNRLMIHGASITGYHSMVFEDGEKRYQFRASSKQYALGTSLCYTRKFWESNPFPDKNTGEDNAMVSRAKGIVSVDAGELMIARIHDGNTSEKRSKLHLESWTELECV
jgi:glycosyltransferase involved in cell wall biosynthesis